MKTFKIFIFTIGFLMSTTLQAAPTDPNQQLINHMQSQLTQLQDDTNQKIDALQKVVAKNSADQTTQLQEQIKQIQQENLENTKAVQAQINNLQKNMQSQIDELQKEIQQLINKVH